MSEEQAIQIRRMQPGEAEEIAQLEEECFHDPWTANSISDMLTDPHAIYIVAMQDGHIVGYCGSRTVLDEGDILRVAVRKAWRSQGIASRILAFLLAETPDIHSWYLDVREHNAPALALYRKYGFTAIGRRRGYYRHPADDAILMQRENKSNA